MNLGLKLSPSMGIGTNSTSNPAYTPRGAIHVQAAQIEHEIDELKTVLKVITIYQTLVFNQIKLLCL